LVKKKFRLLISARDPGAARCIIPVIKTALERADLEICIFSQSPATECLADVRIDSIKAKSLPAEKEEDPRLSELLEEAKTIIENFKPDAILTGLSSPGIGIDEALIASAKNIDTYSIQDLEGLVVTAFGKTAKNYFVANNQSKQLTSRHKGIKIYTIGDLKYHQYSNLEPSTLRTEGRSTLGLNTNDRAITFYGQPAWHTSGYVSSIVELAKNLDQNQKIFYRPHPKETDTDIKNTIRIFEEKNLAIKIDGTACIEESLCATDAVITVYSTCATDLIHLIRNSKSPLGVAVYLFFEPDIKDIYIQDCGIEIPTQVESGFSFAVKQRELIKETIHLALLKSTASRVWDKVNKNLPPTKLAPNALLNIILGL
jgi:hypothetical protein